jgi:hypothetical protein
MVGAASEAAPEAQLARAGDAAANVAFRSAFANHCLSLLLEMVSQRQRDCADSRCDGVELSHGCTFPHNASRPESADSAPASPARILTAAG